MLLFCLTRFRIFFYDNNHNKNKNNTFETQTRFDNSKTQSLVFQILELFGFSYFSKNLNFLRFIFYANIYWRIRPKIYQIKTRKESESYVGLWGSIQIPISISHIQRLQIYLRARTIVDKTVNFGALTLREKKFERRDWKDVCRT